MNKTNLNKKQEQLNKKEKQFNEIANETKQEKTIPENVVKAGETVDVYKPSKVKIRSNLNAFLKREHFGLNSVLRTISEQWNTQLMEEFINSIGLNDTSYLFKDDKINRDFIVSCFPFFTNEKGQQRMAKQAPINEKRAATFTFGNYTDVNNNVITNDKEKEIKYEKNGKMYTLIEIQSFSVWSILSIIAKEGRKQSTLKRLDEKAAKKAEKETEKETKKAVKETEKETKK